jgi:C4-dicarboxylate transporter DctQ subunit
MLLRLFPKPVFKAVAIFGAVRRGLSLCCCLIDSAWLGIGGQDTGGAMVYWSKFYQIGIGLDDLRYPEWMQEHSA